MNKEIRYFLKKYHKFYTARKTVTRMIVLPTIITFLVAIIKYIESYLGLIIFSLLLILLIMLQQAHFYIEEKEGEKLRVFSDRYFKVINWINELVCRKSNLILESISSGNSANLKDENRRPLLVTKIAMRNFKLQKTIDEIITIIHKIIREISIVKHPNVDCNLNIRVNIIGKDPKNTESFKVLSHKETVESALSKSEIKELNLTDNKTIFNKLWNDDSEKLISIKNTDSESFHFFNEKQKDQLKSVMFYRIDHIDDGDNRLPFAIICVDINMPDFFPDKKTHEEEFNFYNVMFQSFEIRLVYAIRFGILANYVETVIKDLEHESKIN